MIPGIFDFRDRYAGDTSKGVTFEIKNSVDDAESTPVNLTGVEFLMHIKKCDTVVKIITQTDGITVVDAINGVFVVDAFIVDFAADKYVYDIQLTFPTEVVSTYLRGKFNVVRDISR